MRLTTPKLLILVSRNYLFHSSQVSLPALHPISSSAGSHETFQSLFPGQLASYTIRGAWSRHSSRNVRPRCKFPLPAAVGVLIRSSLHGKTVLVSLPMSHISCPRSLIQPPRSWSGGEVATAWLEERNRSSKLDLPVRCPLHFSALLYILHSTTAYQVSTHCRTK